MILINSCQMLYLAMKVTYHPFYLFVSMLRAGTFNVNDFVRSTRSDHGGKRK